ncbi:MAG: tagatose 1,6-diphosphate aldolase [Isosphaeraceae bacterium]|jgi:tagatose 1,6-diphosphate aldolase|nr:MAG: tagatose 1,6-diphosphate aldolase [Isosphaeraceae bacterium]
MTTETTNGRPLGATVLTARGLTPGKLRGLQRISNPNGTLTMLALDQNSSMIELAAKALRAAGLDRPPTYDEIVEAKLDLCRHLSPPASAVLLDAYYGAWPAVASFALPADKGLLIRLERSGTPKNAAGGYLGVVEPGWSVEKIKLMGGDALKLLAQFEPWERSSAEHQLGFLQGVYEECRKYDLLMLLEPISYPYGGETKLDPAYLRRKAETVIETARQISRWCDLYKAEFPGTFGVESDEQLMDNLHALSESSERPWVLLSAGVDYDQYLRQVRMAVDAGASGVLGGRAFWKEYFQQPDRASRIRFAATTGRERVAEVDALVRERATPWFARYGLSREELESIRPAEGWQLRYAPYARAAGGAEGGTAFRPGEVY